MACLKMLDLGAQQRGDSTYLEGVALDSWLAEYISAAVGEAWSIQETPRAARVTLEFYEDLRKAVVLAERSSTAPKPAHVSAGVYVPRARGLAHMGRFLLEKIVAAEAESRKVLIEIEESLRSLLTKCVDICLLGMRTREAVICMQRARKTWSEIGGTADQTMGTKRRIVGLLSSLDNGCRRKETVAAANRLISAREQLLRGPGKQPSAPVPGFHGVPGLEEDEPGRFQSALEVLVSEGVGYSEISRMAGFASKHPGRNISLLIKSLSDGEGWALERLTGFYEAYEKWRCGVEPYGGGGGGSSMLLESGPKEELEERLAELAWCVGAVGDLLVGGVTYKNLASNLGFSNQNAKRDVVRFLTRACRRYDSGAARIPMLKRALTRHQRYLVCLSLWGPRPRGRVPGNAKAAAAWESVELESDEEDARDALGREEKDAILRALRHVVSIPGSERCWIPAVAAIPHLIEPHGIAAEIGCGSACALRGVEYMLKGALGDQGRAVRARRYVLNRLSDFIVVGAGYLERIEYEQRASAQSRLYRCVVEARSRLLAASEAIAREEAEGRAVISATEDLTSSSLGLSVARLDPVAWLRRSVFALRGQGEAWSDIARLAGYAGRDPEGSIQRLLCGVDAWRLDAMWGGLRRRERRLVEARHVILRAACEEEATGRSVIVAEEAAGIRSALDELRDCRGAERIWFPYDVEQLISRGYTYTSLAELTGLGGTAKPSRTFAGLLHGVRQGELRDHSKIEMFRRSASVLY